MNFLNKTINNNFALICLLIFLCSCSITSNIKKGFKQQQNSSSYFSGFVLYDPILKKELVNHNGAKYFTPASNTKLYTFYTAYKVLKDSLKGLEYTKINDSLIIKGTADPSLFYGFDSTKVVSFLKKNTAKIYLVDAEIDESPFGSGWAWDDYPYYYMPEKSLLPLYGNIVNFQLKNDSITSYPAYFKPSITLVDSTSIDRDRFKNSFYLEKKSKRNKYVPFKTSNKLTANLLSDFLDKEVQLISDDKEYNFTTINSAPKDSVLKQLLVVSDNFIAEQLLLQVGKKVANKYSVNAAIKYTLKNYLSDLPQEPRWVDGSGLSRYNLFTPQSTVKLLDKMHAEIPKDKLLNYFPVGGRSGTLKNWYGNNKPFVFAKSGTLSNNYSLSGYLITKKGRLLIFSHMNNHYKIPLKEVKLTIEKLLLQIHNSY